MKTEQFKAGLFAMLATAEQQVIKARKSNNIDPSTLQYIEGLRDGVQAAVSLFEQQPGKDAAK